MCIKQTTLYICGHPYSSELIVCSRRYEHVPKQERSLHSSASDCDDCERKRDHRERDHRRRGIIVAGTGSRSSSLSSSSSTSTTSITVLTRDACIHLVDSSSDDGYLDPSSYSRQQAKVGSDDHWLADRAGDWDRVREFDLNYENRHGRRTTIKGREREREIKVRDRHHGDFRFRRSTTTLEW